METIYYIMPYLANTCQVNSQKLLTKSCTKNLKHAPKTTWLINDLESCFNHNALLIIKEKKSIMLQCRNCQESYNTRCCKQDISKHLVLHLKKKCNGAQLHLVGTHHYSKFSTYLV